MRHEAGGIIKVVMISKALVVGAYQRKLEELARAPDLELACVVPPAWRQDGRDLRLERMHTRGYELIVEPIRWNGRFHVFYLPGLGKRLAQLRPDIVHVDEEPYNLATFLAVRRALRVGARPLFFTWQNLYRVYPPPFRWMERYVLRNASHAIAGNTEAAEVLRRKGYQGPVSVIPQFGVDPEVFSPPRKKVIHPADSALKGTERGRGHFVIGYLGRLVEEKGLWILLEAVSGLDGNWRLELYGHGPLQVPLMARAAALGLAERISVRDPVPSADVPARLHGLDALVLPSLSRPNWKEQFGRVLVEAMACGLPVIGSDSGEIPNVIGEAGLIFPEGDVASLRARLADLMGSERLRAEIGALGRGRVLERFTHQKIAAATAQVYRQIAAHAIPAA